MYLADLSLYAFRNYREVSLNFQPGLFVLVGENAQGKTNLMEAICMLATATSFHAGSDREVVNWHAPEQVARVSGKVKRREDELSLEISIFDPQAAHAGVPLPTSTPRKQYKLNGAPKRAIDIIGQLRVVLFAPDDLHLVDGSPSERRKFLDRALCQISPRYAQANVKYRQVVTQRAALLKRVRERLDDARSLDYLDEQLTNHAAFLMYERQRMIRALNEQVDSYQHAISGGREHLLLTYQPSFAISENWNPAEYQAAFQEQLREARKKEIAQGVCLLGPHRDDLDFLVNERSVLMYGSRGQQRTAALAAKLGELSFMHTQTGDEPVLLLDDVFSELDQRRKGYLLEQVLRYQQVFLTTTDPSDLPGDATRFSIQQGRVASLVH